MNKLPFDDIDGLILSRLSGETDGEPDSLDELRRRLRDSPEDRARFQALREIWLAGGVIGQMDSFDEDKAYRRFQARTRQPSERDGRRMLARWFAYGAAAVALLFVITYASYRRGGEEVRSRFADMTVEAPWGSKIKVYLPDGTLVWLNAGSKITCSQGFGVGERNVSLSGEGYFEVAENERIPFCVKTGEMHVRVLGTRFNFSNYPDSEEAIVSLIEGNVRADMLIGKSEQVNLSPDQRIFLNKKTGRMRLLKQKAQPAAEWTNGLLFFDEELLPDIIRTLERSYDVNIRLAEPSLETFRFYGEFVRRELTIENVLDLLTSTNRLKYTKQGKEITLSATDK
ncbi:MAG: DUF4974 domain-containing protein [Tannerella sp.]|nr:DUF4974 domain-containing protein [Tannerella sp.]